MSIENFFKEGYIFELSDKILKEAQEHKIILRLMGGVAIRVHCPQYRNIHNRFNRNLPDIDFVGYLKQAVEIQKLFLELGFREDKNVMRLFGTQRRIFEIPNQNIHCDVVLDKLRFCHEIDLRERLEPDFPTIPLADLLLSKLQIAKITEKDLIDISILLLEHRVEKGEEKEVIDADYISLLCSRDWGLWKTATMNLEKTQSFIKNLVFIETPQKIEIESKIKFVLRIIQDSKKTFKWKARNLFGEKLPWYNEVEELER